MKVYVKSWCPWCIEAIEWLEKHGYQFEKIDVLKDSAAYAHMRKISNQSLTPTLEVDGEVLADFDVNQLERFLKIHNIRPE